MNCQECELMLALDERSAELDAHLVGCPGCSELATEMAANSDALREMNAEPMPQVRSMVLAEIRAQESRRRVMRWGWALAAAAAVVVVFGVARKDRAKPDVGRPFQTAAALPRAEQKAEPVQRTVAKRPVEARRRPGMVAPLRVKMLTSDPNIVIYWIVESKEGSD